MKNLKFKKEWDKLTERVFYLTENIPESDIGIELKGDEDHFQNNWDTGKLELTKEGDYAKASITIYDNNGDLSLYGKSLNLELKTYICVEHMENNNLSSEETLEKCEDLNYFFNFLNQMVANYWAKKNNRHTNKN